MKLLIEPQKIESLKCRDKIPIECLYCHNTFFRTKNDVLAVLHKKTLKKGKKLKFCSVACSNHFGCTKTVFCTNCKKEITKPLSSFKKIKNTFCSSSCAASYNNKHKRHGSRRSKLEKWIENKLLFLYPSFNIQFNKKDAIGSELDIYFPTLKLAFELNGIFHYEPIHGEKKLSSIKTNDCCKFKTCIEKGIELCIIDTSSQKYFKEQNSKEFLDIITSIVSLKLQSNYS